MANYRDDRDALRNKADVLEGELAGTKAELEQAEADNDAKDAEIARLRKIAGEPRREDPRGRKRAVLVGTLALVAVVCGAVGFTVMRVPTSSRIRVAPAPTAQTAVAGPATEAKAPAGPVTNARFAAKIAKVTGRSDVKAGQACWIDVAAVLGGKQAFEELTVVCGSVELYRLTNRAGTIMSMSSWNLAETAGGYALDYEDVGQRSGDARAQIAIASGRKAGRIFTEGALPAEVTFEVEPVGKPRD